MRTSRRVQLLCVSVVALQLLATAVAADVRALTPAEREACRLVVAHLTSGPSALWQATSRSSRLRKLGEAEGTREIAIHVGPSARAEFELVTVAPSLSASTDRKSTRLNSSHLH